MKGCNKITDVGIQIIAGECSNLQTLKAKYCEQITHAGITEIVNKCSNLQILNIKGCTNITDVRIKEIEKYFCPQTINTTDCTKIINAEIKAIPQHSPFSERSFEDSHIQVPLLAIGRNIT